jgi:hypothetical protein
VTGERPPFLLGDPAEEVTAGAEVLPLLSLYGLSSQDFGPASEPFLGSDGGCRQRRSPAHQPRWQDEATAFARRSLAGTDYVYWVDEIYLEVRLEGQGSAVVTSRSM